MTWCTKHQRQCSPGSADCITGWAVSRKWAVACWAGEESQQARWPHSRHWRNATQDVPSLRQSSQTPASLVSTAQVAARWAQLSSGAGRRPTGSSCSCWGCTRSISDSSTSSIASTSATTAESTRPELRISSTRSRSAAIIASRTRA